MLRIVSGEGIASRQAILQLTMELAVAAQELGLVPVRNKASRNPDSASRYLTLRDHGQRLWLIRVSNHRMPVHSSQPLPHLDFVSLDGVAGLHEATVFLHRVAMGRAIWFDSTDPQHRREHRRTRRSPRS